MTDGFRPSWGVLLCLPCTKWPQVTVHVKFWGCFIIFLSLFLILPINVSAITFQACGSLVRQTTYVSSALGRVFQHVVRALRLLFMGKAHGFWSLGFFLGNYVFICCPEHCKGCVPILLLLVFSSAPGWWSCLGRDTWRNLVLLLVLWNRGEIKS